MHLFSTNFIKIPLFTTVFRYLNFEQKNYQIFKPMPVE